MSSTDLNKESTPVDDNDDLFSKTPAILMNYKSYLNKTTEQVFWITLYFAIAAAAFVVGVTIMACIYKHVVEPCIIHRYSRFFS
jgi:hypothetical protein